MRKDQVFDSDGNEVSFKLWPDDPDGMVDDHDGTIRALTNDEKNDIVREAAETAKAQRLRSLPDIRAKVGRAQGVRALQAELLRLVEIVEDQYGDDV